MPQAALARRAAFSVLIKTTTIEKGADWHSTSSGGRRAQRAQVSRAKPMIKRGRSLGRGLGELLLRKILKIQT